MRGHRPWILTLIVAVAGALLASCAVVEKGADILTAQGKMKPGDRDALVKTTQALRSSFADITEEEEYYIGRAVAALILSKYSVQENSALTDYLNVLGTALTYYSDRPETYGGYHFLLLDSDEVNALSAPGGLIFVTRGLLMRCRNEEMLACVLAHEIGHVSAKHGLESIKKSRLVDAFKIIGQESAKRYGAGELAKLTNAFEGVLGDIVESLIENGYDRKYEYEADELGVKFALKTGFNPNGIIDFLKTMAGDTSSAAGKGWFKTHPTAEQRMERIQSQIAILGTVPQTLDVRTQRFSELTSGLR